MSCVVLGSLPVWCQLAGFFLNWCAHYDFVMAPAEMRSNEHAVIFVLAAVTVEHWYYHQEHCSTSRYGGCELYRFLY
jgi:hypothetical protein